MTKHTPAPWHDGDACGNIWHTADNGRNRGVVLGCGDGIAINNEADRDLILAAPDMYEALVVAKANMDIEGSRGVVYTVLCDALKKARGEV